MSIVPGYDFILDDNTDWSRAVPPSRRVEAERPPEETDPGAIANRHRPTLIYNFPLPENLVGHSPARAAVARPRQQQHALMEFDNPNYNAGGGGGSNRRSETRTTPTNNAGHQSSPSVNRQQQQQSRTPNSSSTIRAARVDAHVRINNNITSSASPTTVINTPPPPSRVMPASSTAATTNDADDDTDAVVLQNVLSEEERRLNAFRRARQQRQEQEREQTRNTQLPETALATLISQQQSQQRSRNSMPPPPSSISALNNNNNSPTPNRPAVANYNSPPAGRPSISSNSTSAGAANNSTTFNRLFGEDDPLGNPHFPRTQRVNRQQQQGSPQNNVSPSPARATTSNQNNGNITRTVYNTPERNNNGGDGSWQIQDFSYEALSALTEGMSVSTGLSQKQLSKYKAVPFSKEDYKKNRRKVGVNDDDDEDYTCSICLEELQDGVSCLTLSCSHCYHGNCILGWLQKNNKCPTCRFEIPRMSGT